MTINELLYNIFVLPPDVAVLKFLIFLLLTAFLMLILPRLPVFRENHRLGRVLALLISLMAVLGMGNNYIIGIITGYSWAIIVLFILLPIVGMIFLLTLKGDSPAISLLKVITTGVILFALTSFRGVIQNYNSGYLDIGRGAGITLNDVFGIVIFTVMIVMFYYIFELIARVIFQGSAPGHPEEP